MSEHSFKNAVFEMSILVVPKFAGLGKYIRGCLVYKHLTAMLSTILCHSYCMWFYVSKRFVPST